MEDLSPLRKSPSQPRTSSKCCLPSILNCWTENRCSLTTLDDGSLSPARWAFPKNRMSPLAGSWITCSWIRTVFQPSWECKRSVNTATRRTIVGQLLEYAAHASESWTADKMRECFEAHCQARRLAPTAELADLLETDDADLDGFFQEVARNLDARRMRLLFVADEIPDSLLRVVEFLNQQMLDVEVLAVAIKQFVSKATETFVPRVLGRTAGASRYGPTGLRRKPNAVVKLVEARTLADGTQLKLKVEALPPGARDRVGAWIEKNPARGRATWQNDKQRPLKWAADGKSYSPTGLTQDILEEAAGQRPAIGGPRVWLVESSGESLLDLAASPSAADPLSDSLC